jgi:uncharacterized protein YjdB
MFKHLLAVVTASGLLAACGDPPDDPGTEPAPPVTVETVEVEGPLLDLLPGGTVQLTARAFDARGQLVTGRAFRWQSDAPTVATVDSDGLVTAEAAGEVIISASADHATGGVFLTVLGDAPQAVAWVDLEPSSEVELAAGATLRLEATAHAADGQVLVGRTLTWETSNLDVATVSATGVVTGVAAGAAWIAVDCEGQRDEILVRVPDVAPGVPVDHVTLDHTEITLPVGQTIQLVATPRDAEGQPLDRPVTWASNSPAHAGVNATGLVTALDAGVADITATSEGRRASVRVIATFTTGHTLISIDGAALPATLGTLTVTLPDGSTVTRSVRIHDGWLSIDLASQTYEGMLHGVFSSQVEASAVPLPIHYESSGHVAVNPVTGQLTFTPSNPGRTFTGHWVATRLEVRWQPDDRIAHEATLLFDTN